MHTPTKEIIAKFGETVELSCITASYLTYSDVFWYMVPRNQNMQRHNEIIAREIDTDGSSKYSKQFLSDKDSKNYTLRVLILNPF